MNKPNISTPIYTRNHMLPATFIAKRKPGKDEFLFIRFNGDNTDDIVSTIRSLKYPFKYEGYTSIGRVMALHQRDSTGLTINSINYREGDYVQVDCYGNIHCNYEENINAVYDVLNVAV